VNRESKRFRSSMLLKFLVPLILGVLMVGLLAAIALVVLAVLGVLG
jgi:hypothetical protein